MPLYNIRIPVEVREVDAEVSGALEPSSMDFRVSADNQPAAVEYLRALINGALNSRRELPALYGDIAFVREWDGHR